MPAAGGGGGGGLQPITAIQWTDIDTVLSLAGPLAASSHFRALAVAVLSFKGCSAEEKGPSRKGLFSFINATGDKTSSSAAASPDHKL
jgi:hypothetical protein